MMEVHLYGIDLMRVIFRSVFVNDTQAPPPLKLHGVGRISHNLRSYLVFLQGKVNSARYIARLLTPCYCNFFGRKVMCFSSRTTHVHIRLLRRNMLFMVYKNCPAQ